MRSNDRKYTISAAFTNETNQEVLYLSLPSSSGGQYLAGVCVVKNKIVVAHECPASRLKKPCWHNETATQAFLEHLWWRKELQQYEVVHLNRKIQLSEDWVQIPVPGQPIEIGVDQNELHTA